MLPGIDGFEVCRRIRASDSKIGIIMLIGLVAKNGILIVEFANQKQEAGIDKLHAIEEASLQRLRPILMPRASAMPSRALSRGSSPRVWKLPPLLWPIWATGSRAILTRVERIMCMPASRASRPSARP